jgi:hypothetical protein
MHWSLRGGRERVLSSFWLWSLCLFSDLGKVL